MTSRRRRLLALATASLALAIPALPIASAATPSIGQLSSELAHQRAREQSLSSSIGGLSGTIASLTAQIDLVRNREAQVRADLERDRAALARTSRSLQRERARLARLRSELSWSRTLLSRQLVSSYEGGQPDLVTVLLESGGFADLLDQMSYLHDAESQQQQLISITRAAKAATTRETRRLATLQAADRELTNGATVRVRALAGMNELLASRQGALASALAAQQSALSASRVLSGSLQGRINSIRAQQARAAAAAAAAARAAATAAATSSGSSGSSGSSTGAAVGPALGPSGGWAIPYAIVLCESGGQNLPPNSAGASGYYQIMPATWKLFGGSGPAAYLASKSEQDAVASRIWAGGAGASNWVCAGIVGIH